MKQLAIFLLASAVFSIFSSCNSQPTTAGNRAARNNDGPIGGGCESCELIYEGMPKNIPTADTSEGWDQGGDRLVISGTVYQTDGRTPAPGIIIYYWHTDRDGYYSHRAGMPEKARRHGHLRGWIKTGTDGKYALYTIRPAPYPGATEPAHIHLVIKEPDLNEYYIDELFFEGDPFLTAEKRSHLSNRGGNGILQITLREKRLQAAVHNIILGLNIPGYPR